MVMKLILLGEFFFKVPMEEYMTDQKNWNFASMVSSILRFQYHT